MAPVSSQVRRRQSAGLRCGGDRVTLLGYTYCLNATARPKPVHGTAQPNGKEEIAARQWNGRAALFKHARSRRRSGLFLRRFLTEEAEKYFYRGKTRDEAYEILRHWANLESQGHLARKETALDAGFLEKVFGDALGYRSHPESPEDYQLERNFSVPGVGTADAALGNFSPARRPPRLS